MSTAHRPLPRRVLASLAYLAAAASVVGLLALMVQDPEGVVPGPAIADVTGGAAATAPSREAAAPAIPACRDVKLTKAKPLVTCATRSARLTITSGANPVLLRDVHARVLGAHFAAAPAPETAAGANGAQPSAERGGTVTVRLRVRNGAPQGMRFNVGRRQVYLAVGGRKIRTTGTAGGGLAGIVPRGEADNGVVRFPVDARTVQRLRQAGGRADLGLVPFYQMRSRNQTRIGVVRMRIGMGA